METTQESSTNTRRTWRLRSQFSLRFMLFAVTAFAFGFMLLAHRMELRRREVAMQSARDFVNQELMQRHFSGSGRTSWVFDVIDITNGIQYLKASKLAQSLDEFEKKAIAQLEAGATEVGLATWDGEIRYVQAINTTESCVQCQSKTGAIAAPMTGRIAVVSLRRPPK